MSEGPDLSKLKSWWKEREAKAKKKKWGWPVLIVYALLICFLLFSKYSCTWGNDGTYENDNVFFFEKLWFQCKSLPEFDREYMNGSIARCLSWHPGEDPWKCNMNSQLPDPNFINFTIGGDLFNETANN